MTEAEEDWAADKAAGTLDDPTDPNWENPGCCKCGEHATVVVTPIGSRGHGNIELGAPYAPGSKYYCNAHEPKR